MKKYLPILIFLLLYAALLAGCACQHQWTEADCTEAAHCTKCDATEGDALGHSWKEADCVTARTCSRCGTAEGEPLGHSWTEATCTAPKRCSICAATEGEPLEHTWAGEATLYTAPYCSVCGTEGEPLPGYFAQHGLSVNVRPETETDYITNTYVRPDLNTTGALIASDVLVFEGDANHRAKKDYEWRRVDITITFRDSNSGLYGTNILFARADYYQDLELMRAGKTDRFAVNCNGKEYRCILTCENADYYFTGDSYVYRVSCFAQVPVGYDGVTLAFLHGSVSADGMHLHEVEDENMLLIRLA